MKYWKLYCLFFCCCSTITHAQRTYTLSGHVSLPSGVAPSGNILLLNASDSSLFQGSFFVDGQIRMEKIPYKALLLQLTSLEFQDTIFALPFPDREQVDLGTIILTPSELYLDEVVVKSRRPTYVQKSNGTVEVTIENTVLSASSSTQEILSKSPEITVDENGGIGVFGKGATIIFLDEQRITSNQLALISPSIIRSIEIIRNPSARYDAEGGAVILIHTLRPSENGTQVSLKQNVTYSTFAGWKTFSTANLNLRSGNFLSRAYVSIEQGKDKFFKGTTRDRAPSDVFISSDLKTDWLPLLDYDWRYGLGLQWMLDKRSYASLEYNGFTQATSGLISSTNSIKTDQLLGIYDVDIQRDEKDLNHSLSLNFKKELDTLGSSLFVGGQLSNFDSKMDNPIIETSTENEVNTSRQLFNIEDRNVVILSGQVDYEQLLTDNTSIEAGFKYSFINNSSDATFLVAEQHSSFELDPNLSNQFGYQERVAAGYLQWSRRVNKRWNYKVGIRSEMTNYRLEVDAIADDLADRYLDLFPSASIGYKHSEQYQFNLSYSSRINRQDYSRLNPGLIYQDPYTSIQGNPFLLPQKVQSLEFTSQLNRTNIKLGYSYTKNPFAGAAIPGADELSYILIRLNLDLEQSYYASISRNFNTKYWSSTTTLSQYFVKGEESEFGLVGKSPIPHWYLYSVNRFKFGSLFDFEALFWSFNSYRDGTINRTPAWNLSLSLEKALFDKSLILRLIANDIFHSQRADGNYIAGVTNITFRNKWNSNYFRVAITYDFGKLQRKEYKNRSIGKDAEKRVR